MMFQVLNPILMFWWLLLCGAALVAVVPVLVRLYHRFCSGRFKDLAQYNLSGRVYVITGATSGIGEATTFELYNRGATCVLLCRNREKADRMCARMLSEQPIAIAGGKLSVVECSLDSLQSVRLAARQLLAKHDRIDALINNAGQGGEPIYKRTPDGLEQTMAANYFGHLLLTVLLIDRLKESRPARIVNVSSLLYSFGNLDVDKLDSKERSHDANAAYCNSKLAQVLMTRYLSEKLSGSGVVINALHPGLVGTPIVKYFPCGGFGFVQSLWNAMAKTPYEGAQTSLYLAVADETANVTGEYYSECVRVKLQGQATEPAVAEALWKKSLELVDCEDPFD